MFAGGLVIVGLGLAAIHFYRQIIVTDLDDPKACLKTFKANRDAGFLIAFGLALHTLIDGVALGAVMLGEASDHGHGVTALAGFGVFLADPQTAVSCRVI